MTKLVEKTYVCELSDLCELYGVEEPEKNFRVEIIKFDDGSWSVDDDHGLLTDDDWAPMDPEHIEYIEENFSQLI